MTTAPAKPNRADTPNEGGPIGDRNLHQIAEDRMGNPFEHERRKSMTPQRRARIFAAHDERCHKCTRKIRPGEDWDVDHVLALERGGTDEDDNLAPICEWCHTDKTADDHATAGHMRRGYTKHNVPSRFRKSRGWR